MAESYKGEELYPSQSSATSQGGETTSGTEDISRYYKKLVQQAKRKSKRRSARLVEKAAKASPPKEEIVAHTHRYHTRSQPLSRSQLEEAGRKRKPKARGKVRKPTLTRRKNSAPPSRKVQELRVAKREKKADEITSLLESLECNSPLDELPLELKRRMRPGWYWKGKKKINQPMVFPASHPVYPGQPKGLRQVVRERFGEDACRGLKHEGLVQLLSACEDFRSQKTLLQEEAEARGDKVIYGVKFHPELAPIGAAYRSIAERIRVSNTAGSSAGFKERVENVQDESGLTLQLIRKFFRSSREYLRHYREGKSMKEIESLRSQKRKHRGASHVLGDDAASAKKGRFSRDRLN